MIEDFMLIENEKLRDCRERERIACRSINFDEHLYVNNDM